MLHKCDSKIRHTGWNTVPYFKVYGFKRKENSVVITNVNMLLHAQFE